MKHFEDSPSPDMLGGHSSRCSLAELRKGDSAIVLRVTGDREQSDIRLRLLELGFVPGEPIRIVAEAFPGHDPMAVRVGNSTFALRRHEARCVEVAPERT